MENKIKIAPSILSADFSRLADEVKAVAIAGADYIHVDVMDGVFVPNLTIGPCVVRSIRDKVRIPFDVHLMIEKPENFINEFADAGADIITFHIEACKDPASVIKKIRHAKKKVGISIRPKTPLSKVAPYLKEVDMVLIMTVEPGFSGQAFMPAMLTKIRDLRNVFDKDIEVDGGINAKTSLDVISNGANIIVAGTSIFGEKNYKDAIRRLKGE